MGRLLEGIPHTKLGYVPPKYTSGFAGEKVFLNVSVNPADRQLFQFLVGQRHCK